MTIKPIAFVVCHGLPLMGWIVRYVCLKATLPTSFNLLLALKKSVEFHNMLVANMEECIDFF